MEGGLGDRKRHPLPGPGRGALSLVAVSGALFPFSPLTCLPNSSLSFSPPPPLPPPPPPAPSFPSPSISLFFCPQSFPVSCFPPGPPGLPFRICSLFPEVLFHSLAPIQIPLLESLPTSVGGHPTHCGEFRAVFSPECPSPPEESSWDDCA